MVAVVLNLCSKFYEKILNFVETLKIFAYETSRIV